MLKTAVDSNIIQYCEDFGVRKDSTLESLRNETMRLSNNAQLLITTVQGNLLKILVQLHGAKNVLEIGMFTGYSALWIAKGLPPDGKLVTLDLSDKYLELARQHWKLDGLDAQITPIIAPAEESIKKLLADNQIFDIVFIDANKTQYIQYYESALQLLQSGGLVIIDNTLMYGKVLVDNPDKKYVHILKELNQLILNDKRVDISMLPIGDGMTIARKR